MNRFANPAQVAEPAPRRVARGVGPRTTRLRQRIGVEVEMVPQLTHNLGVAWPAAAGETNEP
jgi:hypothetical protein